MDERVTAQFYDQECEEWTMQTVTIEDVLDSVCDDYTVLPSTQSERKNGKMADLIDRKTTYYILTEYYHHRTLIQHMALADALSKVPTVPTEQQWTPCKEEPPKECGTYLVTLVRNNETRCVTVRDYSLRHGFNTFTNETVIAWMPYPEAYMEEEK